MKKSLNLNNNDIYQRFVARDPSLDGFYYACVKTTKIFCNISCGARKPNIENVEFVTSIDIAIKNNYRACKRCKPQKSNSQISDISLYFIEQLRNAPNERWNGKKITNLGYDIDTVRRAFQRDFGTSFLKFARAFRLGSTISNLQNGQSIIDAQLDAGYSSPSGFLEAFKKQIGTLPSNINDAKILSAKWIDTPIGPMIGIVGDDGLHLLEFFERKGLPNELEALKKKTAPIAFQHHELHNILESQLHEYFKKIRLKFDIPLAQFGSNFEQAAWRSLIQIPYGETRSYTQQAISIGNPNAVRAIARANGLNKIAIIVPCHRVIGQDGSMTGYAGKIWRKEWLLAHEKNNIIQMKEE